MKIGFVLDDSLDKPDGVQQYILTVGTWLSQQGHEVHYLVGESRRTDITHMHSLSKNINVRFNQNRMSIPLPVSKQKLAALLEREQFDVLHVQMPHSPMFAARLVRLAAPTTAIIGTFHIVPYSRRERLASRALGFWLRRNLALFDEIVSVSEPAALCAEKCFRVESKVIPNAVNTSVLATGRRLPKYDDGKINVVFLGRLVERKGCQHLLEAVAYLHAKQPLMNVRIIICGKGPLQPELKEYVRKHRLGSFVYFAGFVSEKDKPHMLASAHIAVFPSTGGESFGIVLVEAMAAGAEVVLAGDNVGYASVLAGREELLVNPHDVEAFAKKLKHFLTNGRARKRAYNWQQKQVDKYDARTVGQALLATYRQAIARRQNSK